MAFTAPRTWVTGTLVTGTQLNTDIRDNIRYLKGQDGTLVLEAGQEMTGTQSYHRLSVLTATQKNALPGTAAGVAVYDSTQGLIGVYGTGWETVPSAPGTSSVKGQYVEMRGANIKPGFAGPMAMLLWWHSGLGAGTVFGPSANEVILPMSAVRNAGDSAVGISLPSPGTLRNLLIDVGTNTLSGGGTCCVAVMVQGTLSNLQRTINAGTGTSYITVSGIDVPILATQRVAFNVNMSGTSGTVLIRQMVAELK